MKYLLLFFFPILLFAQNDSTGVRQSVSGAFWKEKTVSALDFTVDSLDLFSIPAHCIIEEIYIGTDTAWAKGDSISIGIEGERITKPSQVIKIAAADFVIEQCLSIPVSRYVHHAHGSEYIGAVGDMTISMPAGEAEENYRTLRPFNAGGSPENIIITDSSLIIGEYGDGHYSVSVNSSVSLDVVQTTLHAAIFINDVEKTEGEQEYYSPAPSTINPVDLTGLFSLAEGDEVKVKMVADKAADATVTHFNLSLVRQVGHFETLCTGATEKPLVIYLYGDTASMVGRITIRIQYRYIP